jgi:electron-transferring-flavoprotein dehydrogenase
MPILPPPLENHGNYVVSLNKLVRWLGEKCEEAGVNIFPEFPGAEMLYEGTAVTGFVQATKESIRLANRSRISNREWILRRR